MYDIQTLDGLYPDKYVPGFKSSVHKIITKCTNLTYKLQKVMEIGLGKLIFNKGS